jgi:hypothetical protein
MLEQLKPKLFIGKIKDNDQDIPIQNKQLCLRFVNSIHNNIILFKPDHSHLIL